MKIGSQFFSGMFAPLTMAGNIVVDGVLASSYADYDHDLCHIGMTPLRWFPEIIDWIFGIDILSQSIFTKMAQDIVKLCQKPSGRILHPMIRSY